MRRTSRPILPGLGADTCYTSPYFTANPGSMHGYDVCDHNAINPGARRTGGARPLRRPSGRDSAWATWSTSCRITWVSAPARTRGGATSSRTVPGRRERGTSMSTGLRSRRHSRQSSCCRSSVISTAACSNAASCASSSRTASSSSKYFDYVLPTNPRLAPQVYRRAIGPLTAELGADNPQLHEFLSILTSLQNLPELDGPATRQQRRLGTPSSRAHHGAR